MNCGCIGIFRTDRLDESYRSILRRYQAYVKEDTCWFSIELEWHIKATYTKHETKMLTNVFGCFPQEILIFGESDRIFIAAYEIIKHLGGLLKARVSYERAVINSHPGVKIEIFEKNYREPLKHKADYWLVDHNFIKSYYTFLTEQNYAKFRLDPFLPSA